MGASASTNADDAAYQQHSHASPANAETPARAITEDDPNGLSAPMEDSNEADSWNIIFQESYGGSHDLTGDHLPNDIDVRLRSKLAYHTTVALHRPRPCLDATQNVLLLLALLLYAMGWAAPFMPTLAIMAYDLTLPTVAVVIIIGYMYSSHVAAKAACSDILHMTRETLIVPFNRAGYSIACMAMRPKRAEYRKFYHIRRIAPSASLELIAGATMEATVSQDTADSMPQQQPSMLFEDASPSIHVGGYRPSHMLSIHHVPWNAIHNSATAGLIQLSQEQLEIIWGIVRAMYVKVNMVYFYQKRANWYRCVKIFPYIGYGSFAIFALFRFHHALTLFVAVIHAAVLTVLFFNNFIIPPKELANIKAATHNEVNDLMVKKFRCAIEYATQSNGCLRRDTQYIRFVPIR
mmetsp:Transcript_19273/g.53598  ORF Transcript_19273/g.53598 Transcript_19273/m.53598 type:complete len:407 (-) Transcript_19273:105-1325(-)|eukprot:CAMPEP_0198118346 /NCGR_PEP_ID=MMETSP1442-20131203/21313_1 /TAXON_ID= /ORGANISM="Craspedostauros australis, Strain CCMP3328" /LENGTH=406 /DNA_ID=CAMNT_0043776591 /DNA_START=23 /DNA_END=1243 /DNA_ORIENTATION=+